MSFIHDRDLRVMLIELSEIKKEQLLRLKEWLEADLPKGREVLSGLERKTWVASKILDILIEHAVM